MPQVSTVLHQMSPPAVRCWMRLMKPDNGSGPCGFWCPGDIHRHRSAPRNPGPGLSFGIIWVYLEMGAGETNHLMVDCWLIIISPFRPFWILDFPHSWAKRDLVAVSLAPGSNVGAEVAPTRLGGHNLCHQRLWNADPVGSLKKLSIGKAMVFLRKKHGKTKDV